MFFWAFWKANTREKSENPRKNDRKPVGKTRTNHLAMGSYKAKPLGYLGDEKTLPFGSLFERLTVGSSPG